MLHHVSFSTLWLSTCPRAYRLLCPSHNPDHIISLVTNVPWLLHSLPISAHFCAISHQSPPWHVLSQAQDQIIAAFQSLSQTPPPPWPLPYDVICNSCPGGASGKNRPASVGDLREVGSVSGWGRSPGEGNGNPPQYLCLENPMGRGA